MPTVPVSMVVSPTMPSPTTHNDVAAVPLNPEAVATALPAATLRRVSPARPKPSSTFVDVLPPPSAYAEDELPPPTPPNMVYAPLSERLKNYGMPTPPQQQPPPAPSMALPNAPRHASYDAATIAAPTTDPQPHSSRGSAAREAEPAAPVPAVQQPSSTGTGGDGFQYADVATDAGVESSDDQGFFSPALEAERAAAAAADGVVRDYKSGTTPPMHSPEMSPQLPPSSPGAGHLQNELNNPESRANGTRAPHVDRNVHVNAAMPYSVLSSPPLSPPAMPKERVAVGDAHVAQPQYPTGATRSLGALPHSPPNSPDAEATAPALPRAVSSKAMLPPRGYASEGGATTTAPTARTSQFDVDSLPPMAPSNVVSAAAGPVQASPAVNPRSTDTAEAMAAALLSMLSDTAKTMDITVAGRGVADAERYPSVPPSDARSGGGGDGATAVVPINTDRVDAVDHAPNRLAGAGYPLRYRIVVHGRCAHCTGVYDYCANVNAYPMWFDATARRWLYSTPRGYWRFTNDAKDFATGAGYVVSGAPHAGVLPHEVSQWESRHYANVLVEFEATTLSDARGRPVPPPRVRGTPASASVSPGSPPPFASPSPRTATPASVHAPAAYDDSRVFDTPASSPPPPYATPPAHATAESRRRTSPPRPQVVRTPGEYLRDASLGQLPSPCVPSTPHGAPPQTAPPLEAFADDILSYLVTPAGGRPPPPPQPDGRGGEKRRSSAGRVLAALHAAILPDSPRAAGQREEWG